MKIVAVTACPTGIAHTYMAQEAIEKECKKRGHEVQVETQGSMGIENELEQEDIDQAYADLLNTCSDLVNIYTYDSLQDLLNKANGYEAKDYTTESYENLQKAITAGKAATADMSNSELKVLITSLNDAINKLEKNEIKVEDGSQTNLSKPGQVTPSVKEDVATGDKVNVLPFALTSLLSLSSILYFMKRMVLFVFEFYNCL